MATINSGLSVIGVSLVGTSVTLTIIGVVVVVVMVVETGIAVLVGSSDGVVVVSMFSAHLNCLMQFNNAI